MRLPGIVNVATVTYRTHVYDTSAYPSVFYGLPAARSPLRPDAGPDLQQALLLLSRQDADEDAAAPVRRAAERPFAGVRFGP